MANKPFYEQDWWLAMTPEQRKAWARANFPEYRSGQPLPGSVPAGGVPSVGTSVPTSAKTVPGGNTGVGDAKGLSWGGAGNWLKDNANWLLPAGLSIWSAIEGNKADNRSNELSDRALAFKERQYAELEPLRVGAMDRLQNAERPDLSALTADAGNPYAATRRRIPRVGRGV